MNPITDKACYNIIVNNVLSCYISVMCVPKVSISLPPIACHCSIMNNNGKIFIWTTRQYFYKDITQ